MELVEAQVALHKEVENTHRSDLASAIAAAMDNLVATAHDPYRVVSAPHRRMLYQILTNLWLDSVKGSSELMTTYFSENFKHIKADNFQPIVTQYIDRYGSISAAQIIRTTEKQVNDMMLGGLRRGEAQQAVMEKIVNKIPELSEIRAAVISRTEAHAAAQFASQKLAEKSQKPLVKVWQSVNDSRTRDFFGRIDEFNHRVMHGAKVALDARFSVPTSKGGAEAINFPGDPTGSAGNIINCRCVQTYEEDNNARA